MSPRRHKIKMARLRKKQYDRAWAREWREAVKSGYVYTPFCPLIVTEIDLDQYEGKIRKWVAPQFRKNPNERFEWVPLREINQRITPDDQQPSPSHRTE